jgi:hypothetical protein
VHGLRLRADAGPLLADMRQHALARENRLFQRHKRRRRLCSATRVDDFAALQYNGSGAEKSQCSYRLATPVGDPPMDCYERITCTGENPAPHDRRDQKNALNESARGVYSLLTLGPA